MSDSGTNAGRRCPACGGGNPHEAVFCANEACHKALGEFEFVNEVAAARSSRLERMADRVARFTAHPHFVTLHVAWFAAWMALNSGLVVAIAAFDAYPYSLLGILLAIEAILITGFLLISQARQARHAELRAELDYEVNVRSYRKLIEIERRLDAASGSGSIPANATTINPRA
jgi:uncharacterized membrane protein